MRRNRIATILTVLSLIAALAASVLLLFIPFYEGASVDPVALQQIDLSATLLEVNGYGVLIPLSVPPVLAAAGLIAVLRTVRRRKIIVSVLASLLGGFVFITGFSIGIFYLPAAVLLAVAALLVQDRVENRG